MLKTAFAVITLVVVACLFITGKPVTAWDQKPAHALYQVGVIHDDETCPGTDYKASCSVCGEKGACNKACEGRMECAIVYQDGKAACYYRKTTPKCKTGGTTLWGTLAW